jgi:hypothetical protein
MNTSIFAIDAVIGLSNGMIHALQAGFPSMSIWDTLGDITKKSSDLGLGGLLVMIAFLVLTVMLLVYYVGRLITLYIGAVLSPIVLLLYLIPSFKDFAINALKMYLMVIFVLFVQVVIMQLASSIFSGMLQGDNSGQPNTLMALIVGLATVLALLKTQGVMQELTHAASTPRAAREVAGSFMRGVSYMHNLNSRRHKNVPPGGKKKKNDDSSENNNTDPNKGKNTNRRPATYHDTPSLKTGETKRAKRPPREDSIDIEEPEPKPRKKRARKEIET